MKRIYTFVICSSLLILAVPLSLAGDDRAKVTTVFDKRTVELNDEIQLTIRITGGRANVLRPRIPHFDNFESYYTGRSSQFTFVNGQSQSTTSFTYVLVPKRAGKVTLPPIEVEVDHDIYRTDPIEVEVLDSGTSAQGAPASPRGARAGMPALPGSTQGGAIPGSPVSSPSVIQRPVRPVAMPETDQDIFLHATADKLEAYPNEQILLTYSVFTRLSTRTEQFERDPNLNGFWVEEIPIERDYEPEKVVLSGLEYLKGDVKRVAIFPTATGTFEIDPGVFRATVKKEAQPSSLFDEFFDDSFFSGSLFSRREQKLLSARPLKIVVRPLPEQGKPADFSGMVGQFRMDASVDKRSVKQNEPVVLTITIEGEGNIEMLERPRMPELRDVKIFDSDSSTQLAKYRAGVSGKKTFEVTFIPLVAGEFEIPALSFSYFDSRQGTFQTLRTSPYQVKVSPGPAVPLPSMVGQTGAGKDLKKKIEFENRDIHFIKEKMSLARQGAPSKMMTACLLVVDGFLSLWCLVWWFRRRYEERLESNLALKRSRYAIRGIQKGSKLLKKLNFSKEEERRKFFELAQRILSAYFADKFNLSAHGLTFQEIESRLVERNLPQADLAPLRALYEVCDKVRFTSSSSTEVRREDVLQVIKKMADFLEKRT